jgi:hypothetical protein
MSTEENKAIVRRRFEEVLNDKRLDRPDDHVAHQAAEHEEGDGRDVGPTHRWSPEPGDGDDLEALSGLCRDVLG